MTIFFAIILGVFFGFALQRVGATNPQNIINMLRLRDLHLMKAIFFAIGISSALLFLLISIGLIDAGNLSVKSSYIGVILGGGLLGLGFAVAGYCPGTSLTALADGRKDALSFVGGGLVGALIYTMVYGSIKGSWLFDKIAGGKVMLATGSDKFQALLPMIPGPLLAVLIGVVFMVIAWKLPDKA
ncbi:MAG: YeeE/YedE family protein [Desulfobacteraceae bacterium]|nr:YeeE/YedE family protein [Desulfobacteraceae bacterium]